MFFDRRISLVQRRKEQLKSLLFSSIREYIFMILTAYNRLDEEGITSNEVGSPAWRTAFRLKYKLSIKPDIHRNRKQESYGLQNNM